MVGKFRQTGRLDLSDFANVLQRFLGRIVQSHEVVGDIHQLHLFAGVVTVHGHCSQLLFAGDLGDLCLDRFQKLIHSNPPEALEMQLPLLLHTPRFKLLDLR
jgi:hypothetical protein